LPRHLDLDTLRQADLQEIILSLNLTPRKYLGYLTPRAMVNSGVRGQAAAFSSAS